MASARLWVPVGVVRLVFFIGSLATGGAERQFALLADGLVKRGHEVTLSTLYPGGQNWDWLERKGSAKLEALYPSKPSAKARVAAQLAGAPGRLRKLLRQTRAELVYSMLYISNAIAWLAVQRPRGLPIVWGIRASNLELNWKRDVPFRAGKLMSRTVPLVISNSRTGLAHHEENGYRPKARIVIPNGIDTDYFQHHVSEREDLRGQWGIAKGDTLVGLVARLTPIKDHATFLGAAAILKGHAAGFRFVCVGGGSGDYAARLRKLAVDLDLDESLIWSEQRADMRAVYSALDINVVCSLGEGLANVVPEAMSTTTPCVVTDVGDLRWVVGDTGEVVPPADPEGLANGILAMTSRLRADHGLGGAARARVVSEFSLDAFIVRTEDALRRVCDAS